MLAYVLTGLVGLVVVLTRLRLAQTHPGRLLDAHTGIGLVGLVVWTLFLVWPHDSWPGGSLVGVVGLGCWWVVGVLGLVILARWVPSGRGGRRAARRAARPSDSWSRGPWLSVLAHVGSFLAVGYFTWAYVTGAV